MLPKLLSVLGLSALLARSRRAIEEVARSAEEKIKAKAVSVGIIAALALAGATMAVITFAVLLIAIYHFAKQAWGADVAVILVLAIPAGLTLLFAVLVLLRTRSREDISRRATLTEATSASRSAPPPEPHLASATSVVSAAPQPIEIQRMLAGAVREFVRSPPTTGTPVDSVIHRFTEEAAGASDKTVGLAVDLVSSGSRKAVFGVLASTLVLGWFLARRPDVTPSG